MSVLKTFNERFYFVLEVRFEEGKWDVYESPISSDVYEAMTHYLRFVALEDDHHKRADVLKSDVVVSLGPDGPWELLTIAPAWRMCEPVVQDVIERCLLTKYEWATRYLMEADTQSHEEIMSMARGEQS